MRYLTLLFFLMFTFPVFSQVEEIYEFVEVQPSFPGCEDIVDLSERQRCSDRKMVQFISKNAGYPSVARESGFEGTVFIRFVVEPDGSISNIEVLKDNTPGGGLKEAALKAIHAMNEMPEKWNPGRQSGEAVRVRVVVPVKIKLMDEEDFSQEELAPEEPSFSVETNYKPSKSTQKLICGIWKIESINGQFIAENGRIEFKKNKKVIMTSDGKSTSGATWRILDDGKKIEITDEEDSSVDISGIVSLDKKKLILMNSYIGEIVSRRVKK
jgi:TonB family protein